MRILGLETTERSGSVAALDNNNVLLQNDLDQNQGSARTLAPAIKGLLHQVGWRAADVQLVAVTIGPGSFTGLRVGVVTAKALAYATGADILGIDTLEVVAAAVPDDIPSVWAAIDAQRGDVVVKPFQREPAGWMRPAGAEQLIAAETWLSRLPDGSAIAGPGLRRALARVPKHVVVIDPQHWAPRAANVARLAARDFAAGRRDDLWTIAPRYARRSAAEEKWEARGL